MEHFYIERKTCNPVKEKFFSNSMVKFLYNPLRENYNFLFKMLTSSRSSKAAAFFYYDFLPALNPLKSVNELLDEFSIEKSELYPDLESYKNPKSVFERKINYLTKRPMPDSDFSIVSPCDSRISIGDENSNSVFFIKNKFFSMEELISKKKWSDTFKLGNFAVFRLTPDKYHYNHCPVSGIVEDFYEIEGANHSCNPYAVQKIEKPLSKNRRAVTIINTDVSGGTKAGMVAMVEIAALMIGKIIQCCSSNLYDENKEMKKGLFLKKGMPKSRFAPGSSTVVLLFEKNKVRFDEDLLFFSKLKNIPSIFTNDFENPLVEIDLNVREQIAVKL